MLSTSRSQGRGHAEYVRWVFLACPFQTSCTGFIPHASPAAGGGRHLCRASAAFSAHLIRSSSQGSTLLCWMDTRSGRPRIRRRRWWSGRRNASTSSVPPAVCCPRLPVPAGSPRTRARQQPRRRRAAHGHGWLRPRRRTAAAAPPPRRREETVHVDAYAGR